MFLFDDDTLDGDYREYTLNDELESRLKKGESVGITFCHPDFGEVFHATSHVWIGEVVEGTA